MEEDKVKTELSKLTMNIHLFFLFSFFLEETIRKDQTRIRIQRSYSQLQSEPLNLSRHRGGLST